MQEKEKEGFSTKEEPLESETRTVAKRSCDTISGEGTLAPGRGGGTDGLRGEERSLKKERVGGVGRRHQSLSAQTTVSEREKGGEGSSSTKREENRPLFGGRDRRSKTGLGGEDRNRDNAS